MGRGLPPSSGGTAGVVGVAERRSAGGERVSSPETSRPLPHVRDILARQVSSGVDVYVDVCSRLFDESSEIFWAGWVGGVVLVWLSGLVEGSAWRVGLVRWINCLVGWIFVGWIGRVIRFVGWLVV